MTSAETATGYLQFYYHWRFAYAYSDLIIIIIMDSRRGAAYAMSAGIFKVAFSPRLIFMTHCSHPAIRFGGFAPTMTSSALQKGMVAAWSPST